MILCLLIAFADAGERQLELRGTIEPAPARAVVAIYAAYNPFTATTIAGRDGRFRFRKLPPGTYTISVLAPAQGEVRKTVDVTPAYARNGRVELKIAFIPAAGTERETGTVSARRLSVPREAIAEYDAGRNRLARDDVEGAIEHFRRAVALAPAYSEAWNHLGTIAYQTQKYADAEKYFRRALDADPGAYSPLVNLGGVLINLTRPVEALEYNLRAVRERPEDALAHSQLGLSYLLAGDESKAVEQLKTSKALDPAHFSKPQLALAGIYAHRGERDNAIAELDDYLARHPDSQDAPAVRAQIARLRGR